MNQSECPDNPADGASHCPCYWKDPFHCCVCDTRNGGSK